MIFNLAFHVDHFWHNSNHTLLYIIKRTPEFIHKAPIKKVGHPQSGFVNVLVWQASPKRRANLLLGWRPPPSFNRGVGMNAIYSMRSSTWWPFAKLILGILVYMFCHIQPWSLWFRGTEAMMRSCPRQIYWSESGNGVWSNMVVWTLLKIACQGMYWGWIRGWKQVTPQHRLRCSCFRDARPYWLQLLQAKTVCGQSGSVVVYSTL